MGPMEPVLCKKRIINGAKRLGKGTRLIFYSSRKTCIGKSKLLISSKSNKWHKSIMRMISQATFRLITYHKMTQFTKNILKVFLTEDYGHHSTSTRRLNTDFILSRNVCNYYLIPSKIYWNLSSRAKENFWWRLILKIFQVTFINSAWCSIHL